MASAILSPPRRLAWNNSGANLASGIASTLLTARDAELGLLEVDEFVLPEVIRRTRPRVVALGNLFRDQLDRYGELEHIAERWRAAVADARRRDDARRQRRRPARRLARRRPRGACLRFGVDDPSRARRDLQHAADSKYCVRCGHPYRYDAAYVGHLGAYRCEACGHARPPLDVAAREIEPAGLDGIAFTLATPAGRRPSAARAFPASTTSTTRSPRPSLCLGLGVPLDEIVAGLERFRAAFGRFERFASATGASCCC